VAALYKAVSHIALVTWQCAGPHVQWARCATNILSIFKHHLRGLLVLEFEEYWQYFIRVIEHNKVFQVDANTRAPSIPAATQLCKLVRCPWLDG
jgi:hypothetical protein